MAGVVEYIKSVWNHVWRILLFPTEEWRQISKEKVPIKRIVMGYLLPCVFLCAIFHFTCTLFDGEEPFGLIHSFGAFLLPVIFYGIFYYFAVIVGSVFLFGSGKEKYATEALYTLIPYSMTIYIVVDILLTILPEMDYLIVLDIYVVYLIYTGCRALGIESKGSLTRAVAILSVVMILLPILLYLVLNLLLPNM